MEDVRELSAKKLGKTLGKGIAEFVARQQVTVEIVNPGNIWEEVFDSKVRVLDEQGRPLVRASMSLEPAQRLAKMMGLKRKDLKQKGPIAIKARMGE